MFGRGHYLCQLGKSLCSKIFYIVVKFICLGVRCRAVLSIQLDAYGGQVTAIKNRVV